jgi:hypothetical protein
MTPDPCFLAKHLHKERLMSDQEKTIRVHANVEITTESLVAIVDNAKRLGRKDTADLVAEMITRFLLEKDFEAYVKDTDNYES